MKSYDIDSISVRGLAQVLSDDPTKIHDILPLTRFDVTTHLALTSLVLNPMFSELLTPNNIADIASSLGEERLTIPFAELLCERLPKVMDSWMKKQLISKYKELQSSLHFHHESTNGALSPQQEALKEQHGSNGESWRNQLTGTNTLAVFFKTITKHILEHSPQPIGNEQLLTLIKESWTVNTKGASISLEDFTRLMVDPETGGTSERLINSHLRQRNDGSIDFNAETEYRTRGRGCPMNPFGTLKRAFLFYIDVAEYILNERKQTDQTHTA